MTSIDPTATGASGAARRRGVARIVLASLLASLAACGPAGTPPAPPAPPAAAADPPTNRIEIPPIVRQSLGLTFARVERRPVERVLRVPGRFELEPDARREHRAMVAGRVEPKVRALERVERGQLLFTIDAPQWRRLQQEIAAAQRAIARAETTLASAGPLHHAHLVHGETLRDAVAQWTARVERLEALHAAGGGAGEALANARAALIAARSELAETHEKDVLLHAERAMAEADLAAARLELELRLQEAAALLGGGEGGPDPERLLEIDDGRPRWQRIDRIEVRAASAGVVEDLLVAPGAWIETGEAVLAVVDPRRIRFRAALLQSDLARLGEATAARIVPPGVEGRDRSSAEMTAEVRPSVAGDPRTRTIDLLAFPEAVEGWARPGVHALLELPLEGGRPALAIPSRCVVLDGTRRVFFRRDPANPDRAIRVEADLGADDGRWVVVESGVRAGDEIVLDGVYPLLLSTSGSMPVGGHFHADGTWHADDHGGSSSRR